MKKIILSIFFLLLVLSTAYAQKQSISVLYVGYDPEKAMPERKNQAWASQERFKEEYKTRMHAFVNYLENYFTEVKSIDCRDYTSEISDNYDVTIFDETVRAIKEGVYKVDSITKEVTDFEPVSYLPKDFRRPSVFIGHPASTMGSSLGSKLDWYCLCLNRHAHHINLKHDIFKSPFKVKPTIENRPTPKPILESWDGVDMATEIPMWEVNTEGYQDGKGYRIGMVSRGWGFGDSPDAEVISSGVCAKQKTAVALGRHGNHFLWGFAGSPDYMTKEAKQVFANAIVYTYKMADERIIAPKYNQGIATKAFIDEMLYYTTFKSFKNNVAFLTRFNERNEKQKIELKARQDKGEKLSDLESTILKMPPQKIPTREEYLKKNIGRNSWSSVTGFDTLKIRAFLKENRPYFYSQPNGFYDLRVDEDAKSLGIANTDIKLIDAAITLLEEEKDIEKANRLLWRYTIEDFVTANEWRTWFNNYKDKMFFTQSGGYVWLINDPEANPDVRPRKDKEVEVEKEGTSKAANIKLNEPTHADPVSVGVMVVDGDKKGEKTVVIKAKIMDGYHIYAFVPKSEAFIKTEPGINLPVGTQLIGDWEKSAPSPYPGIDQLYIYKGEPFFKQKIKVGENVKNISVKCWLYYQCCNNSICFPPKKKEFELTL